MHYVPADATGMAKNRFKEILSCLRFQDHEKSTDNRKTEHLCKLRAVVEKLVINYRKYYTVSEYVTVDEQLHSFRGRCIFEFTCQMNPQNMASKSGVYVIHSLDQQLESTETRAKVVSLMNTVLTLAVFFCMFMH